MSYEPVLKCQKTNEASRPTFNGSNQTETAKIGKNVLAIGVPYFIKLIGEVGYLNLIVLVILHEGRKHRIKQIKYRHMKH